MPISDIAIVVIAVEVTAQTLMMAVCLIAGARAWRQMRVELQHMNASFEHGLETVSARINEAVVDARIAARAVEKLATRAGGLVQDAANTAHSVRTAVTVPKALLLTGAASATRWLFSKWRRQPRPVVPVESLDRAEIF